MERNFPVILCELRKERGLSQKEAAAKLSGEGLRGYPNHTNFSLDDPRVQQIDGCLVAVIEGE